MVAAWVSLTALLVATGEAVAHSASVAAFDRHVTATVVAHRTDTLTTSMKVVTWFGTWVTLLVCLALLAVLCLRRRVPVLVVGIALVAWGGEAAGVAIGKAVVGRTRPPEQIWMTVAHGSSWPSGHTAVAGVLFGSLAVATSLIVRPLSVRVLAWALAALMVVAVAYSRIELGVHWFSDTLGSIVFVTGWLTVVVLVLRQVWPASASTRHELSGGDAGSGTTPTRATNGAVVTAPPWTGCGPDP